MIKTTLCKIIIINQKINRKGEVIMKGRKKCWVAFENSAAAAEEEEK